MTNDNEIPVFFTSNDGYNHFTLRNPCILDCDTEVGLISLIMDKQYSQYLFVRIHGELRKCLDFEEQAVRFQNDKELMDFLRCVRDSDLFQEIVDTEKHLEEGWKEI